MDVTEKLEREVRYAMDRVLRDRGYENHAADAEIYQETLDDLTSHVLACVRAA